MWHQVSGRWPPYQDHGATFSPDGVFRFRLHRVWQPRLEQLTWLMLNPSTADAALDDPTIRRCWSFSAAWGYGGFVVGNLFAFRATDPKDIKRRWLAHEPVRGADNDYFLEKMCRDRAVVVAWGNDGLLDGRDKYVLAFITPIAKSIMCLGVNRNGTPKHPLYMSTKTQLQPYVRRVWKDDAGHVVGVDR